MHLARTVEIGLKAIGTALAVWTKIKTAQPAWGAVLREIDEEIQRRNRAPSSDWPVAKPFFEDVYADLRAIKTAWRNPSMHVDKNYDLERAEDILNAVKGWMRNLAAHLDESGTFTA
jgi:hypothetical protein